MIPGHRLMLRKLIGRIKLDLAGSFDCISDQIDARMCDRSVQLETIQKGKIEGYVRAFCSFRQKKQ
jgi:hypothetical protein